MKHPDYDIDFKPAIARYDWDQTYDVLEFVHLPQGFDGLMQQVGIPCFELMAIDRFTPYKYQWAEQYSDYLFNFLKEFNFSPLADINLLYTGLNSPDPAFKVENKETLTTKINNSLTKYSSLAQYPVTLAEGNYTITMLIYCGEQETYNLPIPTINQVSYTLQLKEETTVDLNQIIKGFTHNVNSNYGDIQFTFCCNSIVIAKDGVPIVPITEPFLLYSDIAYYFNYFLNFIKAHFNSDLSFVQDSLDINTQYFEYFIDNFCPIQAYPKSIRLMVDRQSYTNTSRLMDVLYATFPDYLKDYCYLQRANNNKWGGTLLSDLGVTPFPHIFVPFLPRVIFPERPVNQGVYQLPSTTRYFVDLNIDYITEYGTYWINGSPTNFIETDYVYYFITETGARTDRTGFPPFLNNSESFRIQIGWKYYNFLKSTVTNRLQRSVRTLNASITVYRVTTAKEEARTETTIEVNKNVTTNSLPPTITEQQWGDIDITYYVNEVAVKIVDPQVYTDVIDLFVTETFTEADWLNFQQIDAVTEANYLNYLLGIKQQYEQESATW